MMPLVEIVQTGSSSQRALEQAIAFTQHIGKLPLPVRSSPGFLVNRILMPYLVEAFLLYDEGVAAEAIDKAATDFGMPMGPVELADTVGLDICQSVADNLSQAFGIDLPKGLKRFVDNGKLGKKSGEGFYRYKNGKAVKDRDADLGDQKLIQQRLIYRFLNEAAACLDEGIVADKDLLDAGVIFGTGFAPFRGGPMNYCLELGIDSVEQTLAELESRFGERFHAVAGWSKIGGGKSPGARSAPKPKAARPSGDAKAAKTTKRATPKKAAKRKSASKAKPKTGGGESAATGSAGDAKA